MFSCFDMRRTLFYRTRLSRLVTSFSFLFQKPTRESGGGVEWSGDPWVARGELYSPLTPMN